MADRRRGGEFLPCHVAIAKHRIKCVLQPRHSLGIWGKPGTFSFAPHSTCATHRHSPLGYPLPNAVAPSLPATSSPSKKFQLSSSLSLVTFATIDAAETIGYVTSAFDATTNATEGKMASSLRW